MEPNSGRVVLFDMDGVLVPTDQLKAEAHAATVRKLGGDVPADFYRRHMGNSHQAVRAAFIAAAGIAADLDEYTKIYHDIYRELLRTQLHAAPGAISLLSRLSSRGYRLAVVTSSRSWMMDYVLERTAMRTFFEVLVSAEDISRPKPAPDAYLLALQRLALPQSSAVVIEDSEPGVEAARAAGIPTLAVRTAFNVNHDLSQAVSVLPSLEDTSRIIRIIDSVFIPVPALP